MRGLGPVSSAIGTAIVRDLRTISIGFSRMVSMARMGFTAANTVSSPRLTVVNVISDSGEPTTVTDSGDCEAFGVGIGGGCSSGVAALLARGAALFLFRGDGFLVGSSWSTVMAVWSASNTSLGSTLALGAALFLGRPGLRLGVAGVSTVVVVFLLPVVDRRGLVDGAGANSSSLSSIFWVASAISSSDSIIAVRRVAAARRDGRDAMAAYMSKKSERCG